jgi:hypothetical protein
MVTRASGLWIALCTVVWKVTRALPSALISSARTPLSSYKPKYRNLSFITSHKAQAYKKGKGKKRTCETGNETSTLSTVEGEEVG